MTRHEKTAETYKKVASTFKKKADKAYAKAKNDEGGYHYAFAKRSYDTMKKALQKAEELTNAKKKR